MTTMALYEDSKRSVLGRAFDVLDCFERGRPEQSVSAVCHRTGLPPATVHRLLASLVMWGAVERTARGCYRLGPHLWSLGHRVPGIRQLRDVARPHLVDLHAGLRLPALLVGQEQGRAILIDSIAGRANRGLWDHDYAPELGDHPAGRLLIAFADRDVHGTSGQPDRREAAEIRRTGCAIGVTGAADPVCWVVAPLTTLDREVPYCLAVAAPGTSVPARLVAVVKHAASNISADLQAEQRRALGE